MKSIRIFILSVILGAVFASVCFADQRFTVYDTQAEILEHVNQEWVVVGVKVNITSHSNSNSVTGFIRGLNSDGYEIAFIRVDGTVRQDGTATLTGVHRMNKFKYMKADRWEVVSLH